MVGIHDVKIGNQRVGQVTVDKQGLYYQFSCRCQLSGKTIHRLTVYCGGERIDLGICVPVDSQFGLDKRLPCKRFLRGKPEFLLLPKAERGKFAPVYPDEPFAYMTKLKNAFLEIREGQPGIVMKE